MKNNSQRGIALVITLIMLSVITFLTIAFLAVSRRDRASVTTALNQTDSRLMADAALDRFQSDLVTRMIVSGGLLNYDLLQTRNFINTTGYNSSITGLDTNNVNYFDDSGNLLAGDDMIRNIGNLFFDPRPPVFIRDNGGTNDFRFYLDYNQNGRFEANGMQRVVIDEAGNVLKDSSGNIISNVFTGEPEWIGVLQNPLYPHSATNRFIGRYLYLALPIGKTLDLNYIHNYAKADVGTLGANMPGSGDGYSRNQGVGSWELNLAAFLYELNTNMYPAASDYVYNAGNSSANTGAAFRDAVSMLSYRYASNFNTLDSAANYFGSGAINFQYDLIDNYGTDPKLNAPFYNTVDPDNAGLVNNGHWAGSRNTNSYFELQDILEGSKSSGNFTNQLKIVSARANSYDRYTFYRLLNQLGTGSEPEIKGKINLNYTNDVDSDTVNTNFVAWPAVQFFTNTLDRLLTDNLVTHVNGGVTNYFLFNTNNNENFITNTPNALITSHNIQLFPRNQYTAQLHRLLQLAANIYDATTTNKYPTIFRPRVEKNGSITRIFDFVAETNDTAFIATYFGNPVQEKTNSTLIADNLVWGVPVIIGAKKGFPSFSKFAAQTFLQISRDIQVRRPTLSQYPNETNQMYQLGVSNIFACEAWNSYIASYTNQVRIIITNLTTMVLTNTVTGQILWPSTNGVSIFTSGTNLTLAGAWPGVQSKSNAFVLPFYTNSIFLTNSRFTATAPVVFAPNIFTFERNAGFPTPEWGIAITNKLIMAMIDVPQQRVIDFVNLDNMISSVNISEILRGTDTPGSPLADNSPLGGIWKTNRLNGSTVVTVPTIGIQRQMDISAGTETVNEEVWRSYGDQTDPSSRRDSITAFRNFLLNPTATNFLVKAPFSPVVKMVQSTYWEINDPLVHYTVGDLQDGKSPTNTVEFIFPPATPETIKLRTISHRYRPWGRKEGDTSTPAISAGSAKEEDYDYTLKDPRIRWSDDWSFPTNKYPNIGWLGKVHRGTPWQTIYLKAGMADIKAWTNWAGNIESHPTNDWKLMDLFYTAANDNAARGLLSINQTNLAAWSAGLSGVVVVSNSSAAFDSFKNSVGVPLPLTSVVIDPNSIALSNIVRDINGTRLTNYGGTFPTLGSILSVPSLTMSSLNPAAGALRFPSPFIDVSTVDQREFGLNDEAYERIPRQIMSLLKLGKPQYVVYCYGQSLKPANNSLALDAPDDRLFNICTNYQITGEVVTRTLMRVEGPIDHPKTVIQSYTVLPGD